MQGQRGIRYRHWAQSSKRLEEALRLVGGWNTSVLQTEESGQCLSRFHGLDSCGVRRGESSYHVPQFLEQISVKTQGGHSNEVEVTRAGFWENERKRLWWKGYLQGKQATEGAARLDFERAV